MGLHLLDITSLDATSQYSQVMKHVKFPSSNHVKQETIAECSFLTRKETFFSHTPFFTFTDFHFSEKPTNYRQFSKEKNYGYFLSLKFYVLERQF